jgi:hypothetical protein
MEHLQNIQDVFSDKILKVLDYQRGAMHGTKSYSRRRGFRTD